MKKALSILLSGFVRPRRGGFPLVQRIGLISSFERIASQLSSYGRLSWGPVWLDPRGRAIIRDLAFLPHQDRAAVRIESISIRSTSLPGLLEMAPALSQGQLPAQAGLTVTGLRLPMNPMFSDWRMESTGLLLPLRSRGCGAYENMTIGQLIDLDYGQLIIGARLDYRISGDRLHIEMQTLTQGLSQIEQHWELLHSKAIERISDLQGVFEDGYLIDLDYGFQDRGLIEQLQTQCPNYSVVSFKQTMIVNRGWMSIFRPG